MANSKHHRELIAGDIHTAVQFDVANQAARLALDLTVPSPAINFGTACYQQDNGKVYLCLVERDSGSPNYGVNDPSIWKDITAAAAGGQPVSILDHGVLETSNVASIDITGNATVSAIGDAVTIDVTGGGGGIVSIQEDGTPEGTANTLNFSTNLNVSIAGGVATITAPVVAFTSGTVVDNQIVRYDTNGNQIQGGTTQPTIDDSGNIVMVGTATVDGVDVSAFKLEYDTHTHDPADVVATGITDTWVLTAQSNTATWAAPSGSATDVFTGVGKFEYNGVVIPSTDPTFGKWTKNNGTDGSVTRIDISNIALNGLDASGLFLALTGGAHLLIRNGLEASVYDISSVTDNTVYISLAVTFTGKSTFFGNPVVADVNDIGVFAAPNSSAVIAVSQDGDPPVKSGSTLNFTGGGVTVTDGGGDIIDITIGAGAAPVASVFSRTGTVLAAAGDYAASLVSNDSTVDGGTGFVADALNTLDSGKEDTGVAAGLITTHSTNANGHPLAIGVSPGPETAGFMSGPSKTKLDGITAGAQPNWISLSAMNTALSTNIDQSGDARPPTANSVGLTELAIGTAGNLITYGADTEPAFVATSATVGHVLKSAGTGQPPAFGTLVAGSFADNTIALTRLANGIPGGVIVFNTTTGVATDLGAGSPNYVLTSNGSSMPSWSPAAADLTVKENGAGDFTATILDFGAGIIVTESPAGTALITVSASGDVLSSEGTGTTAPNEVVVFSDNNGKNVNGTGVILTNLVATNDSRLSDTRIPTNSSVGLTQLANGTAGNLITYGATNIPEFVATGDLGQVLTGGGSGVAPSFQDPLVVGDVTGPVTSANDNLATFDGNNTKAIKDSGVSITDVGSAISHIGLTANNPHGVSLDNLLSGDIIALNTLLADGTILVSTSNSGEIGTLTTEAAPAPADLFIMERAVDNVKLGVTAATVATASSLRTATNVVSISGAAAPSTGQVLKALSSTVAVWSSLGGAAVLDVGTTAVTVAAGDHGHATLPTTDQKAALVGGDPIVNPPNAGNPFVTLAEVSAFGGGNVIKSGSTTANQLARWVGIGNDVKGSTNVTLSDTGVLTINGMAIESDAISPALGGLFFGGTDHGATPGDNVFTGNTSNAASTKGGEAFFRGGIALGATSEGGDVNIYGGLGNPANTNGEVLIGGYDVTADNSAVYAPSISKEIRFAKGFSVAQTAAAPAALRTNYGRYWVRQSDKKPMFTDGAGVEYDLTAGTGGNVNAGGTLTANYLVIGDGTTAVKTSLVQLDTSGNIILRNDAATNISPANASAGAGSNLVISGGGTPGATTGGDLVILGGNSTSGTDGRVLVGQTQTLSVTIGAAGVPTNIGDGLAVTGSITSGGTAVVLTTDSRLADSRTPTNSSVGLTQLATGTAGNLITYNASGVPAFVATNATVGTVLKSAGTGQPPAFGTLVANSFADNTVALTRLANGTPGGVIAFNTTTGVATDIGAGLQNYVLTSTGSSLPSWQAPTPSGTLTVKENGAGDFTATILDFSTGITVTESPAGTALITVTAGSGDVISSESTGTTALNEVVVFSDANGKNVNGTGVILTNLVATNDSRLADPRAPTANSVGLTELATGTPGNLITYGATNEPEFVATSATAGHVLKSAGTGLPPVFGTIVEASITANAVTNAKLAQMPANTIKGNNTGLLADAVNLSLIDMNNYLGKGAANGYATLDASGKLPTSQLTVSAFEFLGNWNAATNTPTLSSPPPAGSTGNMYRVSVEGTTNLDGITLWKVGDQVVSDGTAWVRFDSTGAVWTVNGLSGTVVIDYSDVGASPAGHTHAGVDLTQAVGLGYTLATNATGTFDLAATPTDLFSLNASLGSNIPECWIQDTDPTITNPIDVKLGDIWIDSNDPAPTYMVRMDI